jgi:opacity protein-like surface antigen
LPPRAGAWASTSTAFCRTSPAGLALGDINATRPGLPGGSISNAGWTVGTGLEFGVVSNVSLKAEYLYVDLGNFNCGLNCGLAPTGNVSFTTSIFRAGANVRASTIPRMNKPGTSGAFPLQLR